MPFYEYECSACKHQTEVLQKISDAPLKKCPECGKQTLKRLISAPVFRLKGGGWYETDFKSDNETKRNLAKDEAPAEKTDAKAEAKPEPKPADAKPADSKPAEVKTARKTTVAKPAKAAAKAKSKPVAKSAAKKRAAAR
jgi:putative FmdB family regulatory protein